MADAVGAVDGLVFDGGVPPGVEEDDIAGGGEIEADAAGAQGNEEDGGAGSVLELFDERLAVLGGTGEEKRVPLALADGGGDEVEHAGELGEDEDLVAFFHEGFEELEQGGELGAFAADGDFADERGM